MKPVPADREAAAVEGAGLRRSRRSRGSSPTESRAPGRGARARHWRAAVRRGRTLDCRTGSIFGGASEAQRQQSHRRLPAAARKFCRLAAVMRQAYRHATGLRSCSNDCERPIICIDRWLWCARFFAKDTPPSPAQAVSGGKVHLNGVRVKPAHAVQTGDHQPRHWRRARRVRALAAARRAPATEAQACYGELPVSIERDAKRPWCCATGGPQPAATGYLLDKRDRRRLVVPAAADAPRQARGPRQLASRTAQLAGDGRKPRSAPPTSCCGASWKASGSRSALRFACSTPTLKTMLPTRPIARQR